MVDILQMISISLDKKELISFLRGSKGYLIEASQYAPTAELPDVGKILSRGIYKVYEEDKNIKNEYEQALFSMLKMTDYDVYIVCVYLASQMFKEKNKLSPFIISKQKILKELKVEIEKRKESIQLGVVYPSGYKNNKAWDELLRFKKIFKEEYDLVLF